MSEYKEEMLVLYGLLESLFKEIRPLYEGNMFMYPNFADLVLAPRLNLGYAMLTLFTPHRTHITIHSDGNVYIGSPNNPDKKVVSIIAKTNWVQETIDAVQKMHCCG